MLTSRLVALLSSVVVLLPACAQSGAAVSPSDPDTAALVARGQRQFLRCASCHVVADSTIVKSGPTLKGVVGRRVASVAGYGYSKSLSEQSFTWDEARLSSWLERPTAIAPGTTMAFEGLPGEADRRALIAYLKTLP